MDATVFEALFGGRERDEHFVYVLECCDRRRIYVGYTINVAARLSQHNGYRTGGARRTRTGRPWSVLMVVHGFPTKKDALAFEHALNAPQVSMHMRFDVYDANSNELFAGVASPSTTRSQCTVFYEALASQNLCGVR